MPDRDNITKLNQAMQFLMPLSSARAATEEEGGGQWIHVMPVGKWKAPWQFMGLEIYEITADHISQFVTNFNAGLPGIDIAVDELHRDGPAPGWIKDVRAEQDGLWARVEWTSLGEDLIANRLYRYVSCAWHDAAILPYEDPITGEKTPWVLVGLALTNKPFFKELPAVADEQPDGMIVCTAASPESSRTDPDRAAGPRPITARGDNPMPDPNKTSNQPPEGGQQSPPPAPPADASAQLATQLAEAKAKNAQLEAQAAERQRADALTALTARFAAVKTKDGQLAPAHAAKLAEAAIEVAEDKREAHVTATIEAMTTGFVPQGELGGAGSAHAGDFNPAFVHEARRFDIDPAFIYAASHRGPGGSLDVAGARVAVGRLAPLAASIEMPSLSYQETMVLIEGLFVAGYESIPTLTQQFCNRVTSSSRTIDYRALGAPPRMREWLDEIEGAVLNTKTAFPVTVRDWEATIEIPLSELQADKLGQYALAIQQMGAFAKQHPDELVAALIVAAETTLCYDGQNLCDTDHSEGISGAQSNLLTTGGDDDDIADVVIDLGTVIAAFQRFKDDKGQYLRIGSRPNTVLDVVCRPEVLPVFNQLATATEISGTTNGWKGRIRPMALPELTTADEWFALYTEGPAKPLVVQYQNEPSALKTLGRDSEHAVKRGRALFTTQGNYTVAPADWRYIIKVQKA